MWPLDDTALTHLQDTALGYQNITVAGGLFIECEGEDPYAVFGQVMHTRNGETYYIIAGAEFTGNSYTTSFANTWTWLSADNALATGQLFDSYAGVASLSGYGSIQVPEYDLLITKTANKTSAGKGEEVTYTIDFTNSGNATTDNIQVTDTILTGFEISDYTVTGPSSHTFST